MEVRQRMLVIPERKPVEKLVERSVLPKGPAKPPPFDPLNFEPVVIGPTWKRDTDGYFVIPELSLGYEIAAWCADNLTNEDGEPWIFTHEQFRFLLWLYEVDERGRFTYRKAVLQRCKGWGKDPFAAAVCLVELLGPCRFAGWDENGYPIGKQHPNPLVLVAAVSESQTQNTMTLFPTMLPKATVVKYGLNVGTEKISGDGGRRILQQITSSFRSNEGKRATFTVLNETHHLVSGNQGHQLYAVIERNLTKAKYGSARVLCITNAYQPGEDSVAEQMRDAYMLTVTINPATGEPYALPAGVLYDSLEAPSNAPLTPDVAPHVLAKVRGDAIWLDIETIVQSIIDRQNPASLSRRFWYNQIVADEEAIVDYKDYDECQLNDVLNEGDEIVLGFDGAKTHDATVLIAMRIRDRFCVPLGIWFNKDPVNNPKWEVPRLEVNGRVDNAFARYKVRAFFADVSYWESYIDQWSEKYRDTLLAKASTGSAIGFDMRGHKEELTRANERLIAMFMDHTIRHDGNHIIRQHVLNTRKLFTDMGVYFTKDSRGTDKHNDAWPATLLALMAMTKYTESTKRPDRARSGRVHFM